MLMILSGISPVLVSIIIFYFKELKEEESSTVLVKINRIQL